MKITTFSAIAKYDTGYKTQQADNKKKRPVM